MIYLQIFQISRNIALNDFRQIILLGHMLQVNLVYLLQIFRLHQTLGDKCVEPINCAGLSHGVAGVELCSWPILKCHGIEST